ncbi:hypothetical protein [Methanothermobacter sp. K4]|uniref:hypothetical protein n=1 Tax=Methanothermobacter sp. K4 TaxID=2913262 RepID=UPI001EDBE28C|nr:hypothetical protein [Methanothermobacter sp. K4]MCG2828340.1 hypothetical protein [Methanothermobacter sp. K4]
MSDQRINLKASKGLLRVAAKNHGEVSIMDIEIKMLLGYCWWYDLPVIETLLDVLEMTLKRAVSEVLPHDELLVDYTVRTNDLPDDSSEVEIIFNEISADGIEFSTPNGLFLKGDDSRGLLQRITSFRRRVNENVQRVL